MKILEILIAILLINVIEANDLGKALKKREYKGKAIFSKLKLLENFLCHLKI